MNVLSRDSRMTMMRSFIAGLAGIFVWPLALWFFSPRAATAEVAAIFDDLNEPAAWTGPVFQHGNPATGKAWFTNGVLTILIRRPRATDAPPEMFRKLARSTPLWRALGRATISGRQ